MLCAAIDIGSNTTRLLVAERQDGRLKKLMEQRAYTRLAKATNGDGMIEPDKVEEVAEVVETQVRLARELEADTFRAVATAALRDAANGPEVVERITERAGIPVTVISEEEEGRLSFVGATRSLAHPVEGRIAVIDVGGGSSELVHGTVSEGVDTVRSWSIGSGSLSDELFSSDPPAAAEVSRARVWIEERLGGVEVELPDQAVAVGGTSNALRKMVGARVEYETLERALRLLCGHPADEVARQFEIDPVRVKVLPAGTLILEKFSEILGCPLQIGRGGLREGVVLDLINGGPGGEDGADR
ncbi:MAG: hypothetical protein M9938_07885 [Solirubrobacterales bacterium]|nr:hypothetical protein [Solirubrobacterales bacterium]